MPHSLHSVIFLSSVSKNKLRCHKTLMILEAKEVLCKSGSSNNNKELMRHVVLWSLMSLC